MIKSRPNAFRVWGSGLVSFVCGAVSRSRLGTEGVASTLACLGWVVHGAREVTSTPAVHSSLMGRP